jgi:hypothetical protein
MTRRWRGVLRAAVAAAVVVLAGGCGDAEERAPARSSALVDLERDPPYVNSLDVEPESGAYLLTTNRGFFRIPAGGGRPERVRGTVRAPEGSSPVGTFLEVDVLGPRELVGSGHPDREQPLPPFLGFMRSTDGGRNWRVVSRLGEADLHQIRRVHGRLYAFDAVLGALLVSRDDGRTWEERTTPRQLILDFVVDPRDPDVILASVESGLYRSQDGGETWRPAGQGRSPRLDWPAPDRLMRADADGRFQTSRDGGSTWDRGARIDGEPHQLRALGPDRALVALVDATILETTDGGASFAERFRP